MSQNRCRDCRFIPLGLMKLNLLLGETLLMERFNASRNLNVKMVFVLFNYCWMKKIILENLRFTFHLFGFCYIDLFCKAFCM